MRRRYALPLALLLSLTAPVWAQTEADRTEVGALIERFDTSFSGGDYEAVLSMMPPRILEALAADNGIAPEQLQQMITAQMQAMMQQVEVERFSMDLENARSGASPTGRPYFVIPTETIMAMPGTGQIRGVSDTLAFEDAGEWWLLRVESAEHQRILSQAYPDLADVEFAPGRLEPLE